MPIINSSLFGSAGQIDNTRIARRLKNNEIIFDGETFSIKDILCNALVGTYSFTNNNSDYLKKARKYGHFTGYKN